MPSTATFGFEYETPQSKPGITLTGDIDGTSPILAEQVDTALSTIEARVSANEGDITALQGLTATDTGWVAMATSAGAGFTVDTALYRRWGPVAAILIITTRTGADIDANSAGNVVGDPTICTIDTLAVRPSQRQEVIGRGFITSGCLDISTSGVISLADLHSNSSLRTDDTMQLSATYFTSTFS